MLDYPIIVREKVIQQDLYYKNHVMLRYTIKYPQFLSARFSYFLEKLNSFYRTKAMLYEKNEIKKLFQLAMIDYEYAKANDFPFRIYEAILENEVTYNRNCAISLYFDQYEYTGGAHGSTIRSSDSWDLQKGIKIELKDILAEDIDIKAFLIAKITDQIESNDPYDKGDFFEDYQELIDTHFDLNQFYLTDAGVEIYFQQYDIAPYSTGMPTFLIPYSPEVIEPKC